MKQLIILLAEVTSVIALAANAEIQSQQPASTTAVTFVEGGTTNRCVLTSVQRKMLASKSRRIEKLKEQAAKKGVSAAELLVEQDRKEAARHGVDPALWADMNKKERSAARQRAQAAKKGMTVEQMKAEALRKAAEKAGCPVEKWAAMSVKERIEFRKRTKQP